MGTSSPLRWLLDELRRSLDDANAALQRYAAAQAQAQSSDLAEVDCSELRLQCQALHQAVGALELVDLHAAAQTVRALEAALQHLMQKPALATPAHAAAVQQGCWAVLDYLQRQARLLSVADAALFPTYRAWQQLAGNARAHPADLWRCEPCAVPLPAGPRVQPAPALRARLEQGVLAWVKHGDAAAAAALAPLAAGLARGTAALPARQYWLAAAAFLELLAQSALPIDVYAKRALAALLSQYAALAQGTNEHTAALTHELLYALAHAPAPAAAPAESLPCWRAHQLAYGWPPAEAGAAASVPALGQADPRLMEMARAAIEQAQQVWGQLGPEGGQAGAVRALLQVAEALPDLGAQALPAAADWAQLWRELAQALDAQGQPWPADWVLEICAALLWLQAELDDAPAQQAERDQQAQALVERLRAMVQGRALAPAPAWLAQTFQAWNERLSRGAVLLAMRQDLALLEQRWSGELQVGQALARASLDAALQRLQALLAVAQVLQWEPACLTLAAMLRHLQPLQSGGAVTPALASALGENLSALGLWLDELAQQPHVWPSGFRFDPEAQRLRVLQPAAPMLASGGAPASPAPAPAPAANADTPAQPPEPELLQVFWDEAQLLAQQIETALQVLRQQPAQRPDLLALRRACHTLKGSARMVGLSALGDCAWAAERQLNLLLAENLPLHPAALQACEQALAQLRLGSAAPPQPAAPPAEPPLLDQVLALPPVLEQALKEVGPLRIELDLFQVFLAEAEGWSRQLQDGVGALARPDCDAAALLQQLAPAAHALGGGAATLGFEGLCALARALEQALQRCASALLWRAPGAQSAPLQPDALAVLAAAVEQVHQLLHQLAAGLLRSPSAELLQGLAGLARPPLAAASTRAQAQEPAALELDLWSVFEQEALQHWGQLHHALQRWQQQPALSSSSTSRAEILRHLHTFKGSARLAGALALGERLHQIESQVLSLPTAPSPADLLALAAAVQEIEIDWARQHPWDGPVALAEPASPPPTAAAQPSADAALAVPTPAAPDASRPSTPATAPLVPAPSLPLAERLERIAVHAADMSASRARIEADWRQLRHALGDMEENVFRLRQQLREFELQTDLQLALVQSAEPEHEPFDPLELDRYTRAQELARTLAEAVNDVAAVQHQMQLALQAAEGNLAAQARQARELQHEVLRCRLQSLDSLSERLQRCLRLTAQACGKSAHLEWAGDAVALERALVERLLPVLEHLLRNAVVHGLESDAERRALGKAVPACIRLAAQWSASDCQLVLSDDGAGLDLPRIAARATELGLLPPGASCSPEQACELIFALGLSTSESVTPLAGRGIGLDAVRQELLALGGQIECQLPAAGGCAFVLRLPRSWGLSRVLLLRLGNMALGVPEEWVEQAEAVDAAALEPAYASARWSQGGTQLPFYWGGALLAVAAQSGPAGHQQAAWVLVCRSAGQRVAWHVDEVLGVQELALKPPAPPLNRLPGLVATALLATGDVLLVYNPVAVSALCADAARAWVRAQTRPPPGTAGPASAALGQGRAQGAAPLLLVVDDSITVRRVTQRLLQREGYRVALAADGWQALAQIERECPALLLCDIEMPRLDGFGLLERLRADPRWAGLPVLVITSRTADKHRQHARQLGVVHYLGKPYAEAELLALVQRYAHRQ